MFHQKRNASGFFVGLLIATNTVAQKSIDTLVSLKAAVEMADQRKHSLQGHRLEAEAAARNVAVSRYIKMPSVDVSYQLNVATANNITGLFYPAGILPMTGPPSVKNNYTPVTGSAASALLSWQAVTFGQQNAQIEVSIAEANSKRLGFEQERLKSGIDVISQYLDVLLALEKLRIQAQNISRVEVNVRQSRVLSTTGIRPGVDTAVFLSELSKAKIEWLDAQRQLETAQWLLAEVIEIDALPLPRDTSILQGPPSTTVNSDSTFNSHPYIQFARSQVEVNRAKTQLFKKSYFPKLTVFGTAFGRGSGVQPAGELKTFGGMGLSRFNYGAGMQLAFPLMKYGEAKRQLHVQNLLTASAQEALSESTSQLTTQQHIAAITMTSSLAEAAETERQLKSAQYAFSAMQTRYATGLVNLSDVVQVQFILLQSELEVKTAYWNAWKALLLHAATQGDLNLFLNEIK